MNQQFIHSSVEPTTEEWHDFVNRLQTTHFPKGEKIVVTALDYTNLHLAPEGLA